MRVRTMMALVVTLGLVGCGGAVDEKPTPTSSDGKPIPVPALGGKADNYISSNAREFELTGTVRARLPENFSEMEGEERESAIDDAVEGRLSTVTRNLKRHVESRVEEANQNAGSSSSDGESEYFMYARSDNEETLDREISEGAVTADFEWELVGSTRLVEVLVADGGERGTFEVEVPGSEEGTSEQLRIDVAASESDDAFPKYDELFADGVYDIGLHIGGDYNDERYDIEVAKWAVQKLLEDGWSNAEVDSYEQLTIDSPPFTKEMTIEGREVEVRVYIYHPEMAESNQDRLTEKMKTSFAKRDVVIYNGHAGPGAGFILDYHPRHEIEPSSFGELPLADKYQIYVFNGCETYRTYVPDLMSNQEKTFENVDIVTTVNKTPIASFYQVTYQFIYWLTFTDQQGRHYPMTWNSILQGVNKKERSDAHYGVHGIDQDPELNPHRSEGVACRSCESQSQCEAGGNYCLQMQSGSACGVACATSDACPEGSRCAPVTEDPEKFYIPKNCVPTRSQCRPS